VERPKTRYARSGDLHIAYQVVGDGPIDLVWIPGWFSHVEQSWEWLDIAAFFERLASFSRLIIFDKRGTGLSDPVPISTPATIEQRMDDVRAVMDAAGSERAALIGLSEGGPMSMVFAATYPERTAALILTGTFARATWDEDYDIGVRREFVEPGIEEIIESWGEGLILQLAAPSMDTPANRRELGRYERSAASPGMVRALMRLNLDIDVRPILSAINVPTLVLHREGDMMTPVEMGEYLAEHIQGAKLVKLPGQDHVPWAGDVDRFVGEIQEYLTGSRETAPPDRVLATVMFNDIVSSTERAAELGDRRWKQLLDRFYETAERQIERFGGRLVDTTGDGVLAMYDGPARAVHSATSIREAVRPLGIEIRAGLHTGECELRGSNIGGIAVHIGARVAANAGPGEVLVSRTVRDLVVGSGLEFSERGEHELKGVPGTWQLYSVEN
jgi:pimeloyl-ACP methyl ester carboxylesterase